MTLQGALASTTRGAIRREQTIGPPINGRRSCHAADVRADRRRERYKDISPRGGLAYDVFGNGKTAVKVNFGKYLEPASNLNGNYSISNPIARIATTRHPDVDRQRHRRCRDARLRRLHPAVRPDQQRGQRRVRRHDRDRPSARRRGPPRRSTRRSLGRLGRAAATTGSSARRCSSRCCRACRSRSATSSAGCRTSPRPTTWSSRRPTSRRSASRRRPIRGCRTAAATRSTACTTSSQAKFGQTSNNITLRTSASSTSATTACCSTSARGQRTA